MQVSWLLADEKRIASSKKVEILNLDSAAECAKCKGSYGIYKTTLYSCECVDFVRHKNRPCKHMIRLAIELNKFDELRTEETESPTSLPSFQNTHSPSNKRTGKKKHSCVALDNYVVIDLETTGIDISSAKIIEIAAARIVDGKIAEEFQTLVNPEIHISDDITNLTGISNAMVSNALLIKEALSLFLDFVGTSPVVGHNISSYDTTLIYDCCQQYFEQEFTNDIVDTCLLSRALHSEIEHVTLENMCLYYKIPNDNAHRALSDVRATYSLYEKLKGYIFREKMLPFSAVFGGYTYTAIYNSIKSMLDTSEKIFLKVNRSGASIYIYGTVAFTICINSRSQYIETSDNAAAAFVADIPGAVSLGTACRFPIASQQKSVPIFAEMVRAVYDSKKDSITCEVFGCCNDFIRCSDARECLHKDNVSYMGCYYRKNLESGHIFYGTNKNI